MIGTLVLLSIYACPALGDMGRITTSEATVHENSQKAIIIHNLDEEILILGTDLISDRNTKILRFIPFPSEPKVSLAQGDPFEQVSELIRKYELTFLSRETKGRTSSAASVEIRFNARLGAHDVTVVKINEIGEFRRWVGEFLAGKGLTPGEDYREVEEVASDYVQRDFKHFVFDLVEVKPEIHFTEPIVYRFKSKELFYPLKTSNTFGGEGGIDLIIISPVTLCDPLHSESLPLTEEASIYIKSLSEEETFIRKVLGGDAMQVSTSAQISREDLKDVDPRAEKFFQENEPVFMQLIRYWGKYGFDDDILIDISQAPREIIDEWNAGDSLPFDYKELRELLKSTKTKPAAVVDKKEDADLILKKACLKATLAAIKMERERFEQRLKVAKEGPGDPQNIPDFEKRIEELDAEYGKYEKMGPAHCAVPEKKTVKVKVTHAYQEGSILELKQMSRSGPFYHVAGIEGNDYELLKPDKTYQMTIYMVYPRDYPFTSHYVYIEDL